MPENTGQAVTSVLGTLGSLFVPGGPLVKAGIVFGASLLYRLLGRQVPQRVPRDTTTLRGDKVTPRHVYGGIVRAPGTRTFENKRVIERETFAGYIDGRNVQIARNTDLPAKWGVPTTVTELSVLDRMIYVSEGELDSLIGLTIEGEYVGLRKHPTENIYIPPPGAKYHGRLFATPYFMSQARPDIPDYREGHYLIWSPENHDPEISYLHVGLIEPRKVTNKQTVSDFWGVREGKQDRPIPREINGVFRGKKVRDLSKFPNHNTQPKVWTNNAFACFYDFLREVIGLQDSDIDLYRILEGYNECGQVIANNYQRYEGATGTALSEGQFAENFYAHWPEKSIQCSVAFVVDEGDERSDAADQFALNFQGDIIETGGKVSPFVGTYREPTLTLDDSMWQGQPQRVAQPPLSHQFNTLTVRHYPAARNFQAHEFTVKNEDAIAKAGRELAAPQVLEFASCSDETEVYRKASNLLYQAANHEQIEGYVAGRLSGIPGETVRLTSASLGINALTYQIREKRYAPKEHRTWVELSRVTPRFYTNQ